MIGEMSSHRTTPASCKSNGSANADELTLRLIFVLLFGSGLHNVSWHREQHVPFS